MAFQIKDFASVSASLVNLVKAATTKVSDFNIGSIIRTMLDAIAAELEELYLQMVIGLREAIPVAVYNSFSFSLIQANAATGLIRVNIASTTTDTLIQSGTAFSAQGSSVTYTSTQDVTIAAGNTYADVPVAASVVGAAGNIASGLVFTPNPSPNGFASASNLVPFINGQDLETEDARKVRFNAFILALSRATLAALDYGLKTTVLYDAQGNPTERVISTSIVEPWVADNSQPLALVNCYIHNGTGGTSGTLVTQAQQVINGYYDSNGNAVPGWKAAGVHTVVYAATEQPLTVTGVLTPLAGYDGPTVRAQAQEAIAAYITGLTIGATALRAEIVATVMNIEGVYNFVASAPAGDTTAANNVKLTPGVITIN